MPKVSHPVTLKLQSYISEFKDDGLITDNKIFCNFYQCALSSTQKFHVQQQHIKTSKHQSNHQ